MWAARRSGLYYVPINTHLTAAEAAYIIDNSSAKAIVGSAALRKTLEGLGTELPNGLPELLIIADDDLGRLAPLPRMRCRPAGYADRRRDRGRPAAVLVGHHRPPEGHQTRVAAPAARRGAGHDVGAGRLLARPRRDLSQPGTALSHRPVGVVDDDSGRGHHDGGDGQVRRRRLPGRDPAPRRHARPVRSGDVHPHAETA